MSEFDDYISVEDKASIIEQRILQFASEGFQHEINRDIATKQNDEETAARSEEAVRLIKEAIEVQKQMLDELKSA